MVRAEAIGWRAHAALTASAGVAKVIAPLSRSFYAEAAGELIWIGGREAALHARALLTTDVPASRADASVRVELDGIAPWQPALPRVPWDTASEAAHMLRAVVTTLGTPRGLARLLHDDGGHDESIVVRAAPHVRALVSACTHDDARAAVDAARPLLGLGDGLTPSGDDFIGGVLFARRLCGVIDPAWDTAIRRIVADATTLTHPISARLLADLAAGEGWAPLHDLAAALAVDRHQAALLAARDVTALGHGSGWDLLAGFLMTATSGARRADVEPGAR